MRPLYGREAALDTPWKAHSPGMVSPLKVE